MGTYLKNSFIVTFIITVGQVLTAILAGYAFAFLEFPFKRTLFVVFLATLMVPFEVTIVTNVATISDLGWYNTYAGLAVPFLATGFGAFLMRQAFLTLPHDLRDAAALDGYGHWRFLWRVAVPLARPAVGALTVFAFLAAWNQYLWPLLITKDEKLRTVQIGLKQLQSAEHRPGQRHVRRRDHRGDPARDPAAVLPEATRARPHRRRGEGMRTPRSSSRPASAPDAGVATPSAMLGSGAGIDRGVHMRGWRRGQERVWRWWCWPPGCRRWPRSRHRARAP